MRHFGQAGQTSVVHNSSILEGFSVSEVFMAKKCWYNGKCIWVYYTASSSYIRSWVGYLGIPTYTYL